ncbi:MAG: DUF779 domain-containing protein [Candidatus Binatia bacterium]
MKSAVSCPLSAMAACEGLTPRAHRLLDRVRGDVPAADPLAFMISGGCCGGTSPVLCRQSNIIGGFDVCLGEADGISVYAHPEHARYLLRDRFVIDAIEDARSDTFSLEIPYGGRFVLRELPDRS